MPHQLHLSAEEQTRFIYFIHKLRSNSGFGEDVLDRATFLELWYFSTMHLINGAALPQKRNQNPPAIMPRLDEILSYINTPHQ